jgi:outer membrane protein assembly factor BamB
MLAFCSRKCAPGILAAFLLCLGAVPLLWGEGIGWRTDGTGIYLKAQPPQEWSTTKNVVWRTPMPGYGVSHPVLLGQRVFICSEPCILLCLNRKDGEVLWKQSCSYADLEIDQATRDQLEVELVKMAELNKKESGIRKEMDQLARALRKDKATNEEINKKTQPFRKQIDELKKEKLKLAVAVRYTQPGTHSFAGYSAPTPVTNGKEVFVAFGNGLVACYDLEGKRKWLKLIEHSNAAFAHSGSPILAGGKLLIHFTDLVALDPKTGEESWRFKHPWSHGTPLTTKIGGTEVVLTPRGAMLRVKDGKLLAENLGSTGANSPILHKGVVYYVRGQVTAVRLPESVDDIEKPLKIKPLWRGKVQGGGYWFSSPVLHDGLLYAASDQGVLSVLEADTGKLVYEESLKMRGSTYPSISLAGGRLYVSSDTGVTVVVQPGREYKELARNKLDDAFRSSLVFDGKRVYARTAKNLYCIGE